MMSGFFVELATPSDFEVILQLQNTNHITRLSEEELSDGFVTTLLTPDSLELMYANQGIWIARTSNRELAAYACANDWDFYGDGPFQRSAHALLPFEFDGRLITSKNSFQYGPVCVSSNVRGHGVLPALVKNIKNHMSARFEFGITFIDTRNTRSLAAHERKLGFRRMALLPAGEVVYHVLAFEAQ